MSNWNLKGKKALITGGTKGIGLAVAEEFLSLGAEIFVVARDKRLLDEKINLWKQQGYNAFGSSKDLSKQEDRKELFNEVNERWETLNILINNVGTNIRKKTVDFTREEYEHVLNTNLFSTFEISRLFYDLLKKSDNNSVVNITSVAGLTHLRTGSPYGMSKAAIDQLTRNLAAEWAEDKIRVNSVAPWYIDTPLVETLMENEEYYREYLKHKHNARIIHNNLKHSSLEVQEIFYYMMDTPPRKKD